MEHIMPPSAPRSLALICPSFCDAFAQQPLRLPALERLVMYGVQALPTAGVRELDAWQCELVQTLDLGDVTQYPSAPLTWLGANNDSEPGTWFHADPVVQAISAHGLTMNLCDPWTADNLSQVELLVRSHLVDSQLTWRNSGVRAFLRTNEPIDVHTTTARQASLSELQEVLPTGPGAVAVRRAMNELQMLLHEKLQYPAAPNAIWLWGAGEMPRLPPRNLPPMWTNDDYTRGIYRAHTSSQCCLPLSTLDLILNENEPTHGRALVVVRDCSLETLEQQWFEPVLRALEKDRLHSVDIFLDGRQLHARHSWLRRLFARSRPLAEWLS
jgi:hypothetical protein